VPGRRHARRARPPGSTLPASSAAQVNDSAHVRPVYAHAESVGGHDDLCPSLQEVALGAVTLSGREPCVVHARAPAEPREPSALLLGGASGWAR